MVVKKPWRKILYENQPYPDNYTDDSFLRDLRTNIKPVSLGEALWGATLLLEEFCTVVAFVLVYVYLYNEWIQPQSIFTISSVFTALGFVFYRLVYSKDVQVNLGHDLRTLLIFMVFGHLFSPVLHTLTDTVSTDTIYTMTFFMMVIHLIFFDYGVSAAIVSNSLSLSAAIFASICLASRLSSAYHAFILITVAVELFVLFPLFRSKIKKSFYIIGPLVLSDVYFLMNSSVLFMIVFILTGVFINIGCPVLFVRYQKYKSNIYGPWDEAIVDDADSVIEGRNK
ncbi:phosphatidylinositol N-acetylglucosaminyltransferase subunit C [Tribolium castaneum]|uniref:Phosphatidylinositol N-acetylglucosaminyltransferase subunit C-like Protein n=1 Tax=Tribolium castaneum TaxID=7070 RepID=D6WGL0_TRICA|nr:PREDICTED: phosphatidylinositol N-acetylglucosaminyltransferase subunit C [Tribolium castaneum]EFA00579.1 Phosphatidylinositol N-acetylglucosaminyltransferase subunit C-like Protein [Tribolium castaneum]|eukprot:XP_971956.1 PREDICTED: phosphatidylinositol N-acetylglucosaminyltransferase subunit C [Tribolium castaneum]